MEMKLVSSQLVVKRMVYGLVLWGLFFSCIQAGVFLLMLSVSVLAMQSCLIKDRIANGSWSWDWRPVNRGRCQADFDNMLVDISLLNIVNDRDSAVFSLSLDNSFSVNIARKYIDDYNSTSSLPSTRWFKAIPRKVNVFMWCLFLDKLPHRFNISSRGIDIDSIMCPNCDQYAETNSRIFFSCTTASNIWRLIRGWCDLKIPSFSSCVDGDNWYSSWRTSKDNRGRAYAIFASTCWILWRSRNNIVFNSQFMRICDMFDSIRLLSFSWLKFKVMDLNTSIGRLCLGKNDRITLNNEVESEGKWYTSEYCDTADSGNKKEIKSFTFYRMEMEEISEPYITLCFVDGLHAYDGEINLTYEKNMISNEFAIKLCLDYEEKEGQTFAKKELLVALRGELYFVKFIINPEEDDVQPGVVFGRSFLRLTKGIIDFENGIITDYPYIITFNDNSDDYLDTILANIDVSDLPPLDISDIPPFMCSTGKVQEIRNNR
ncbi:RNA-directed DNA polymerase, eukaryota [Tanacetum coccineum]